MNKLKKLINIIWYGISQRAKKFRLRYILLVLLAAVMTFVMNLAWQLWMPLKSDQIVLHIQSGDNAGSIATRLAESKIIRSKSLFTMMARLRGSDRRLKAGTYSFGGYYNLVATLGLLEKGNTAAIRITIPAGFSLYQTLKRIDRSGLAAYDTLLALATNPVFVQRHTGSNLSSLEGYIFPDTYYFDIQTPADSILSMPVQLFFRKLKAANIKPDSLANFQQILILASIVEKESAHEEERPIIAGVYLNRLKKGMRLESCPTVDYLLQQRGIKRTVLTNKDLAIESPYNTYRNDGLPPGPICNPSLEAIQAVIKPQKHQYLFFVSNRKGRNDFSQTYEEHLRKKREYEGK